nr:MAG: hypothetical protein DIU78_10195 [Pseudomonadota bacterium]
MLNGPVSIGLLINRHDENQGVVPVDVSDRVRSARRGRGPWNTEIFRRSLAERLAKGTVERLWD